LVDFEEGVHDGREELMDVRELFGLVGEGVEQVF